MTVPVSAKGLRFEYTKMPEPCLGRRHNFFAEFTLGFDMY